MSLHNFIFVAVVGLLILASIAVAYITFAPTDRPSQVDAALVIELRPQDEAFVAMGLQIYTENCASCHGTNLEGQPNWRQRNAVGRVPAPPHDETGHTWHHPDAMLFELTKFGPAQLIGDGYQSDMPGYADTLSDEEILAVLSYIKSQWPDDVRARHDQFNNGATHH